MSKGFGKEQSGKNSIAVAAELLHSISVQAGKPVTIPMLPQGNERGLKPGEIAPGLNELPPSCDGLVVAIACSADDAQELLNLVTDWQRSKLN